MYYFSVGKPQLSAHHSECTLTTLDHKWIDESLMKYRSPPSEVVKAVLVSSMYLASAVSQSPCDSLNPSPPTPSLPARKRNTPIVGAVRILGQPPALLVSRRGCVQTTPGVLTLVLLETWLTAWAVPPVLQPGALAGVLTAGPVWAAYLLPFRWPVRTQGPHIQALLINRLIPCFHNYP